MALGEIAKQLAQQALTDTIVSEPAVAGPPDNVGAIMLAQVQAMQKACKEDEELVVLCRSGGESVRVLDFIVPSWPVLVLAGVDEAKNTTRVVTSAGSVQLICKVLKVQPPREPVRVRFRLPRPKQE